MGKKYTEPQQKYFTAPCKSYMPTCINTFTANNDICGNACPTIVSTHCLSKFHKEDEQSLYEEENALP
jgi:hypothetical protein